MDKDRKINYGMKELYTFYRKTRENAKTYKTFSTVLKAFNSKIVEHALNSDYIKLPYKLGSIYIKKYKPNYKFDENGNIDTFGQPGMIDYKSTKELWKKYPELKHKQRVIYDNSHSDGFKIRIYWKRGNVKNIRLYNFTPSRHFKRSAAKHMRNNPNQEYYDN